MDAGAEERHDYRFNPSANALKDAWKKNGKPTAIAIASVALLFVFYSTATSITGFVTHANDLEALLNETKGALDSAQSANVLCTAKADSLQGNLSECQGSLVNQTDTATACTAKKNELENYSSNLNVLLTQCGNDKDVVSGDLAKKTSDYDGLVRNSARPLCCSSFDILNGKSALWNISGTAITCGSGSYAVNCSTGETNY